VDTTAGVSRNPFAYQCVRRRAPPPPPYAHRITSIKYTVKVSYDISPPPQYARFYHRSPAETDAHFSHMADPPMRPWRLRPDRFRPHHKAVPPLALLASHLTAEHVWSAPRKSRLQVQNAYLTWYRETDAHFVHITCAALECAGVSPAHSHDTA
jgi:hypothetical protein